MVNLVKFMHPNTSSKNSMVSNIATKFSPSVASYLLCNYTHGVSINWSKVDFKILKLGKFLLKYKPVI